MWPQACDLDFLSLSLLISKMGNVSTCWYDTLRWTQCYFSGICTKIYDWIQSQGNMKQNQIKEILQINWTVTLQNFDIMKDKDRPRTYSRLKETWQLNAKCDTRLNPRPRKKYSCDIIGTINKIWIKIYGLNNSIISLLTFLVLIIALLCKRTSLFVGNACWII